MTQTHTLVKDARPAPAGTDQKALKKGTVLTIKEMFAEDLLVSDAHDQPTAKTVALVAHMVDLTFAEVMRLSMPDFTKLASITRGL